MRERPIIFNAPMVRAILDGRKTQTRRIVKPQPWPGVPFIGIAGMVAIWRRDYGDDTSMMSLVRLSHGQPGDRLWVKETFATLCPGSYEEEKPRAGTYQDIRYKASDRMADCADDVRGYRWRPSIHMPRWASRIDLEITAVRVERLQDISEEDAIAEGIEYDQGWEEEPGFGYLDYLSKDDSYSFTNPRDSFRSLWGAAYAKGNYGWSANPWVFIYEFRRIEEAGR